MTTKTEIDAYQDVLVRLSARNRDAAAKLFYSVSDVSDDALDRFSTLASQASLASQRESIRITHGFLRRMEIDEIGSASVDLDMTEALSGVRNGTSSLAVYERPIITARSALASGRNIADALRIGANRAAAAADADVMLASRSASRDYTRRSRSASGFRRSPDSGACDFCLLVSTQRYHAEDLMPIHGNCHCVVVPIFGGKDPGHVIDKQLLADLKAKKIKAEIVEHGELGPMVVPKGQSFERLEA